MASAEDLGKKVLEEVEVVGLDEILHTLRVQSGDTNAQYFDCQPLDRLLQVAADARPQTSKMNTAPPIIEFMSLASGGGKTHLLYYLCAQAVLPAEASGKQGCAVIIDTDGSFCVPRFAAQLELLLRQSSSETNPENERAVKDAILTALKHVHIFRPQTLASAIATIDALPSYLFNNNRHFSFDRAIGFIALDSASAFYWQDRAETEDAAFLATTTAAGPKPAAPQSAYISLATSLKAACKTFNCPAVITTWYLGPTSAPQQQSPYSRSFRPSFPAPFANLPTLRLIVQRVPIRKFPPGISVSDALREAGDRQKAVDEGKFECFVNEWGVDERMLRALRGCEGGSGFAFRIVGEGVVVQESDWVEK